MVRELFGSRHNGTRTVWLSTQWYANRLVLDTMVRKPFGSRHDGAQTVVAAMEVYLRLAVEVCHGGLSYACWTPGRCHMAVLPQSQPQPRLRLGFGELDCKVHLVQLHFSRLGGLEIGLRPTWLDLVRLETESVSRPPSSVVLFLICYIS